MEEQIERRIKPVEDHPTEDWLGSEIQSGDVYFVLGNHVVLEENMKTYLINNQHVECYRAQ